MSENRSPISQAELVSLLAMLSATVAFSIDAMLPALPEIGAALSPDAPNKAQLVLGAFILGLGLGTFFSGPLSDAYGRRPIAVIGAVIYTSAALVAAFSPSLETLILARFVQGLGASGPRVTAMAIVRDLFSGRRMAQVLSYIIFVFTLAPVFAPSIGWAIAWAFGWRAIFVSFAVFSVVSMAWLLLRQPETLTHANRRPFRPLKLLEGLREIAGNRQVRIATAAQTLIFTCLFSALLSIQPIFGVVFGIEDAFPLWFGAMGLLAAGSNLINARIVIRMGMRAVVHRALAIQGGFTLLFLLAQITGAIPEGMFFPLAYLWLTSIFYLAGFGIGNMNALAMEPLGHMAGLGASIITATATICSALLSAPIGLAFDGTMRPLTVGVLVLVALAAVLVGRLEDHTPEQLA
jgi:DHA1 family bicyclomycin/chloramphenicol resistance-like MFS transporter